MSAPVAGSCRIAVRALLSASGRSDRRMGRITRADRGLGCAERAQAKRHNGRRTQQTTIQSFAHLKPP